MSITRRFLLAPSLARLIEKERQGRLIIEGYFPDRSDRSVYVRVEEEAGVLILVSPGPPGPVETPSDLPHSHAEALLDVAAGVVAYRRVDLDVSAAQVHVSRIIASEPLDLITTEFAQEKQAREFEPLPWFGPEVTNEPDYQPAPWLWPGFQPCARWTSQVPPSTACSIFWISGLRPSSRRSNPPFWAETPRAAEVDEGAEDVGIMEGVIHDLAPSGSKPR